MTWIQVKDYESHLNYIDYPHEHWSSQLMNKNAESINYGFLFKNFSAVI